MNKKLVLLIAFIVVSIGFLSGCNQLNVNQSNSELDKFIGTWEGIINTSSEEIIKIKLKEDKQACWWYHGYFYEYLCGTYSISGNQLSLEGWNNHYFSYEFKNDTLYLDGYEFIRQNKNFKVSSKTNISEKEYKNMCQEIEDDWDVIENPSNYIEKDIAFEGMLNKSISNENLSVFKVTGGFLYECSLFVITDKKIDLEVDDSFYAWGKIKGSISYFGETSPYLWAYTITKTIDEPNEISNRALKNLYNNLGLENPTYSEMISFLNRDNTNNLVYSNDFTCVNFSYSMINNARNKGLICEFVTIYQTEKEFYYLDELENATDSHAIVCFNTSDKGIYFVEPQSDEVISKERFEKMKSNGKYPYASTDGTNPMDFHHYKIEYANRLCYYNYSFSSEEDYKDYICKYSWDKISGKWIFECDDEVYTIEN